MPLHISGRAVAVHVELLNAANIQNIIHIRKTIDKVLTIIITLLQLPDTFTAFHQLAQKVLIVLR